MESLKIIVAIALTGVTLAGCATSTPDASENTAEVMGLYTPLFDKNLLIEIKSGDNFIRGSGVWIGNGEVLTAFHIFYEPPFFELKASDIISVIVDGKKMGARVVFHGDLNGNDDLALLKVDDKLIPPSLALSTVPTICESDEKVGAPIYITSYDRIIKTFTSPDGAAVFKGNISSRAATALVSRGTSGSPVFDAQMKCLSGIVSFGDFGQKTEDSDELKCERATVQGLDPQMKSTCAVTFRTVFTDAGAIRSFLKDAHDYARTVGTR
jgi:hypothetical protein